MSNEKIRHLVVDTTGFIKNAPLQDIAAKVYTPDLVVNEIHSKSQLRRLAVLPYELEIKNPFPEFVKLVSEFAKKTGDYAGLSATDIQVIALTYQLEKEHVGINHLRKEPVSRPTLATSGVPSEGLKNVAGFYIPKCFGEESEDVIEDDELLDQKEVIDSDSCDDLTPPDTVQNILEETRIEDNEGLYRGDDNEEEKNDNEEEAEDDDDDEDDDGWITPGNIKDVKARIVSEVEEVVPEVGCLTTDFAMQNVLKQIGLNVVALDGRIIKEIRTFILRCYACYKTTSIMSKLFCPNCGNKTLKKVAVSTDSDGKQHLHINLRKPLTARGKRFSLPTPKGGKHANNPILCEDQRMPQQRASRLSRMKTNALDVDYTAGFSPFVTRDVTSRSAMLGIRPNATVKQWMRKNPNESVKPGGRKRK